MKNSTSILLLIIAVLSFIVWTKSCQKDPEPKPRIIFVPETSAAFEEKAPVYLELEEKPAPIRWKDAPPVFIENPVNDSLVSAYTAVKDSLERFKLYLAAIEIRKFSSAFSDSNITLNITGEVQGQLLSIKPEYTLKEKRLAVENEEVVFRLLLGGTIQNNFVLSDINFTLGAGFQNRKGHIYRMGLLQADGENFLMLGADYSVFTVRR